jgi:hypothetical protein
MMSRVAALRALNRYQIVRSRDQNFGHTNEFEVRPRGGGAAARLRKRPSGKRGAR